MYPTGKRNFVRTPAGMRLTATAMAQFAKQKGVKRLFLSSNGEPYYAEYAAEVGRAAQSLGIRIAGAAPFDPEARNYERFARVSQRPARTGSCSRRGRLPTPAHCCVISAPASVLE